jgi:TatD DNase family protein
MLIDAHAHLDRYVDPVNRLDDAMDEIERHGILTVANAMDLPAYERTVEIAGDCDLAVPIFGVHPWRAPQYADRLDDLRQPTARSAMLGEIGLDHGFVEDENAYPAQRKVLEFFLAAASEQDKVVHLHTKGAEAEVLELLDRYEVRRALVHWYSGPLDLLQDFVARGVYLTVGVEVLYSDHIVTIAREVPPDLLLTETDNPGGPRQYIGGWGMPSLICDVVRGLAEVRGISEDALVDAVQANFLRLIEDDPRLSYVQARILQG